MALSKAAALQVLLFACGEPVAKKKAASMLGFKDADLSAVISELTDLLAGQGIVLVESEDELELRTSPEASDLVKKLREGELTKDLGRAGLETLAVVLYQGSATRSEIDWIRGVNSAQTMRSLLLRGLVQRTEDTADKRKFRYKATTDALAHLGVARKEDLPRYAELAKGATEAIERAATADA